MNKALKIALVGYGKMGKEIEKIIVERGHTVAAIINSKNNINDLLKVQCDAVIEFTQPDVAKTNIEFCVQHQIPIVVGTTGWYQDFERIKQLTVQHNAALFTATNYSIGVNIFFHINTRLAKIMNRYKGYQVTIEEIHHKQKKDAPSGTAITTAEQILSQLDSHKKWISIEEGNYHDVSKDELPIYSFREDNVPGFHKVKWESDIDEIELSHNAHNRRGFALGSVLAAEWLVDKQGVFDMNDMLGFD